MLDFFMRYSEVSAAWSAAIATTLAASVALWLGLREGRLREIERTQRARLIASSVKYRLSDCVRDIEAAIRALKPTEEHFILVTEAASIAHDNMEKVSLAISMDEINLIQPLIGRAAESLAENTAKCRGIALVASKIGNAAREGEVVNLSPDSHSRPRLVALVEHCDSVKEELECVLSVIRHKLNSEPPI